MIASTWLMQAAHAHAPPPQATSLAAEATPTLEQRLQQLERLERARREAGTPATAPVSSAADLAPPATAADIAVGGYVEAFYQWNFNRPANGLTHFRGFDNRHHSPTLQNAVLDVVGVIGQVTTRLAVQFGHTAEFYYLTEPLRQGTSGAGPSGPQVWKFLQQANATWVAPVGRGVTLEAGLFLSPIGPEGMAVKDQWQWSRSNLFVGLPFYHAGARASYPLGRAGTLSLQLYNGWNAVTDGNGALAVAAQYAWHVPERLTFSLLYLGGVERPRGAVEGAPWRHLIDGWAAVHPWPWLSLMAHLDGGWEDNRLGTSGWLAGAGYLRWRPAPRLALSARADLFREWQAGGPLGRAAPLFWAGAAWVASQTITADLRPAPNLSVRLELRRDTAAAPLYFAGDVARDADGRELANALGQWTLTGGVVTWF